MEGSRCVLVAVDGSPHSSATLDQAIELASRLSTDLVVLAVGEPRDMAGDIPHDAVIDAACEDAQQTALEAARVAQARGLCVRVFTDLGVPARCIESTADKVDAQFVVVGVGHGHLLARLLGENVPVWLAENSRRNVVVVHPPPGQPKA